MFLFSEIHDFTHPREGVLYTWELLDQTDLRQATVGDELQIVFDHLRFTPGCFRASFISYKFSLEFLIPVIDGYVIVLGPA